MKKYYPHNIMAIHDLDESVLTVMSECWPVDELIEAKMVDYEIPSSIFCMLRVTTQKDGKVKEYVYQRRHAADKKIKKLLTSDEPTEVLLVTQDTYAVLQNEAFTPYQF